MMTVRQVNFLMSIFPIYFFQQLYPPKPTSYNSECELSGSYVSLECPSPPGPPACLTDSRRDPQVSCTCIYMVYIVAFFYTKSAPHVNFKFPPHARRKKDILGIYSPDLHSAIIYFWHICISHELPRIDNATTTYIYSSFIIVSRWDLCRLHLRICSRALKISFSYACAENCSWELRVYKNIKCATKKYLRFLRKSRAIILKNV